MMGTHTKLTYNSMITGFITMVAYTIMTTNFLTICFRELRTISRRLSSPNPPIKRYWYCDSTMCTLQTHCLFKGGSHFVIINKKEDASNARAKWESHESQHPDPICRGETCKFCRSRGKSCTITRVLWTLSK